MDFFRQFIYDIFFDYTLRTVALGSAVLGCVSGTLGCYAFLRKQSLVGDAISHAALPGIAMAFLLTRSKNTFVLLLGAFIAGWIGMIVVNHIVKTTRIKNDGALGIILSVFFGLGIVLLTFIQKIPDSTQAGLNKFLFGQAATLMHSDVITIGILGCAALCMMILFWKEFKLLCFNPDFAASIGYPITGLDIILTTIIVIAIIIGLQTVGVVLMSAMIIAPAAAARQWTDRMGHMIALAGFFGATAGIAGSIISSSAARLPTGPTIVLCITVIVFISIVLAPNRGLLSYMIQFQRQKKLVLDETILTSLYLLTLKHGSVSRSFPFAMLSVMAERKNIAIKFTLKDLEKRGWVRLFGQSEWALTPEGFVHAQELQEKGKR